ncbi:uncharacterized protein LOC116341438 isoform X2 [Contarinia nasturtii]|uniref:uncharacterized protein LOC116341438 isoform X2 n=1 Tax=Contarinia nasturtii TaxID=265458 RepID=UPI0012D4AF59|nr:uncharacterized protein LOC116341438 isoform X2 [Contarinia nasturtii]
MAEESKQTKIPRFESGTSSSVVTRIPKPGGFTRQSIGISKLARPQVNGISSKTRTSFKPEANPIISEEIPSNSFPRKSLLHRFGVANKVQIKTIPRFRNTNPQRTSQLLPSQNNVRIINETMELTRGTAMNVTKPVIESEKNNDAIMDRTLIRSNTFVCDDAQAKLSITHDIPMASIPSSSQPNDTINQTNLQLNKERTFKRSLSPIPGEPMNSAKRKLMQVSSSSSSLSSSSAAGQKVMSVTHVMPMNSTPRRSITHSDARKSNLTFFGRKSVDFSESQVDQLQTFTFDNTTFEQSNHFAPDATKLDSATNATMHSNNRVFDLTQTVEQNDAFYPETKNCNVTLTLDSNAAEHELKNDDSNKPNIVEKSQPIQIGGTGALSEDLLVAKKRFSLGLELPECTLDCSIELCDSSAATSAQDSSPLVNYNPHSYDMEESLGILTPDQMIEFLDTNATNMKIELPSSLPAKIEPHKCRIDQTPSPEDLPLDTIEVKTIDSSKIEDVDLTLQPSSIVCDNDGPSQTDSYSKTDQMTKSTTSKVTNSFITSVTSIASLDNGYHADGEMSRPASRGAESPMRRVHNARQNKLYAAHDVNVPVVCRRQDPMTDSDFFTESDADVDIFHRGDRRVQIIDGHMYNAQGADVFIDEAQPENEMESSGVYTDVDHRDDVPSNSNSQNENESDMSPDGSTETIKSSEYANINENKKSMPKTDADNNTKQMQKQPWASLPTQSNQSIAAMSNISNSSSTTINDSVTTCLCEKPNIDDGGGDHAQLVISEASSSLPSSSNNNENTSCKLHSIICSDNDNSNSKTAAPQFKSSTPKVKRFSPNRKQFKNDTGSGHSKRNESVGKRESKSIGVKNRTSVVCGLKKSPSISSTSPGSKSPIENGRNSNCENANTINMTSDQSPIAVHVRKIVPNKWDAVMNKIALNKAEVKTVKYSEVKSKVTCGIKRASPNSKTTTNEQQSTTSDSGNSSLISTKSSASPTVTRQSSHGITKRSIERDSSKDSHLSFSRDSAVVTPGKQSKPTTSSARSSTKKRSSIQNGFSPSDTKIDTTAKTDPSTAKSVTLHKRFPANNNLQTTTSSPVSEKRATITASKKSSSASKHVNQTSTPVANKTSHAKELGLQSTPAHPSTINNNNSSISNNNHSTKSGTNSSKLATNDEHHQQPLIATIHRNGKTSAATLIANKAVAVPQINAKSTGKSASRTIVNGELNENLIEFSFVDSIDGDTTGCYASATVSTINTDKTTRNSNQQQKQQTAADLNVIKANKTIVALSILIQHLTTNLNAFETPSLRVALETAKDKLLESQHNLETMRTKCNYLGEQMVAKEKFYTTLKETNERELDKIKLSLRETEKSAQEQIKLLQYELVKVNQQNIDALKLCQMKADRQCSELETQLQLARDRELELVERLNNFTVTENQLRDKVQASEQEFSERLIAATARERELNEKVAQLTRQLKISDDKRYELEEKVKLACDETNDLRHRRNSSEHSISNGNNSVQNQSSSSVMLEEEVLSLRSVLDMKLNEISELRKQNQSMVQAQDELPKAQLKISILESRLEDLTIQLKTKVEEEHELSVRNRSLQEMFNQEVKNRTRLSLHNEELQWKLKQNSEKYTTTLNELSKSYQDPSMLSDFKNSLYAPISETSQERNDTLQLNSSPPTSPVIKGVVEKCDSVSYVLELNDDESAEAVASRVVKRAGSFRVNNYKERSPSFRRQYSLGGANALSQSASATSLSRQHSDSPVKTIGGIVKLQKTPRTRSYSLNASNEPKKTQSVPIEIANSDYTKWQRSMKTMSTSSPLTSSRKYKNNGQPNGLAEIDDDTAGTMSSPISIADVDLAKDFVPAQRSRTTLIPAQNSIKKRQQIKESAGEAMVSQQSEDDQSFGSDSTSASSSSAASPSHSSKHRPLSLDEEAFMNKIVASLSTRSTPMEVSWSEDGDNEPYAQESSA